MGQPVRQRSSLAAGEEKTVTQTVRRAGRRVVEPGQPVPLCARDQHRRRLVDHRFGMREFRCDTASRRALLNGKVYYLRGASITLHRFFGDPQCGGLPWDEAWVRKFLVDIPQQMHWNCLPAVHRPAAQRWLDIADEAGLILQYEFPIWERPRAASATSSGRKAT